MKVLLCSHWFHPSIGGVETASGILACEFLKAGVQVTVATSTPLDTEQDYGYRVLRRPALGELLRAGREADLVFQNLVSLQTLLPLALTGKPIVIAHQSWLRTKEGKRSWQNHVKLAAIRGATNIAISKTIADDLPVPCAVIPNPFEAAEFLPYRDTPKVKDLVFVGRLVSDKGCDLLLDAMALLAARRASPVSLTVIGDGPEMPALREQAKKLQIAEHVEFLGFLRAGRGKAMAEHKIHVVPSRWKEPFGIVALEGIASGCAVVASSGGGLPEAVGPCGLLFPNNDAAQLAEQISRLLDDVAYREQLAAAGPAHLQRFRPEVIAAQYLKTFAEVVS